MTAPIHLDGREKLRDPKANTVAVDQACPAVLLIMRGPELVRSTVRRVVWKVAAQVRHEGAVFGQPLSEPDAWVHLLPDEITLAPLPSTLEAVALACYPFPIRWLFRFWAEDDHPDARADVWALPIDTQSLRCGLFKLPGSEGLGSEGRGLGLEEER